MQQVYDRAANKEVSGEEVKSPIHSDKRYLLFAFKSTTRFHFWKASLKIPPSTKNKFVVDLDTIWKWLGFSKKYYANTVLNKHFIEKVNYIHLATANAVARSDDKKWSGQNIKKTMITI